MIDQVETRYSATIRPATVADVEPSIAVIQHVFDEYGFIFEPADEVPDLLTFAQTYEGQQAAFFVAEVVSEQHTQLVGTIGVFLHPPDYAEIKRLYVRPNVRRQRLGQRLLHTAIAQAQNYGIDRIDLWTDTRFTAAHTFYRRYGFVQGDTMRQLQDINQSEEYFFRLDLRH